MRPRKGSSLSNFEVSAVPTGAAGGRQVAKSEGESGLG